MTTAGDQAPLVRALVQIHRTPQGALWVQVEALTPAEELGCVPLTDLPVLLEALVVDAGV